MGFGIAGMGNEQKARNDDTIGTKAANCTAAPSNAVRVSGFKFISVSLGSFVPIANTYDAARCNG